MRIGVVVSIRADEPAEAAGISHLNMECRAFSERVSKDLGGIQRVDVIEPANGAVRSIRKIIVFA